MLWGKAMCASIQLACLLRFPGRAGGVRKGRQRGGESDVCEKASDGLRIRLNENPHQIDMVAFLDVSSKALQDWSRTVSGEWLSRN